MTPCAKRRTVKLTNQMAGRPHQAQTAPTNREGGTVPGRPSGWWDGATAALTSATAVIQSTASGHARSPIEGQQFMLAPQSHAGVSVMVSCNLSLEDIQPACRVGGRVALWRHQSPNQICTLCRPITRWGHFGCNAGPPAGLKSRGHESARPSVKMATEYCEQSATQVRYVKITTTASRVSIRSNFGDAHIVKYKRPPRSRRSRCPVCALRVLSKYESHLQGKLSRSVSSGDSRP